MKRRSKVSDEWVDLIHERDGQASENNGKNRIGNGGRGMAAIALGVVFVMILLYSNSGDNGGPRNRKVILLGPHDRYNDFGDILAERVVTKLLVDRAGFVYNQTNDSDNTLLLGGVVTRDDMDHHGLTPLKTVHSMKEIQKLSRADVDYGPYDIVFTGGSGEGPGDEGPSILYEKHKDAVALLETEALQSSAEADRVYDCPYLFPKELLLPVVDKSMATNTRKHATGTVLTLPRSKKNYAIVDSLEMPASKEAKDAPLECRRVTVKADHLGLRGSRPYAPDSSVMTQQMFGEDIRDVFENEVRPDLLQFPEFASRQYSASSFHYIAVQHESMKHVSDTNFAQELADALDEVSKNLGDAPVVFFPAGRMGRPVGDHVAFGLSREVAEIMQQPSVLYEVEHAFKVAALIRGAQAVVSTNLHVRILSFVFGKPRATWDGGPHHRTFLDVWEAKDVASLGMLTSVSDTWDKGLQRFFVEPKITQVKTEAASQKAAGQYLKNFHRWSKLLKPEY